MTDPKIWHPNEEQSLKLEWLELSGLHLTDYRIGDRSTLRTVTWTTLYHLFSSGLFWRITFERIESDEIEVYGQAEQLAFLAEWRRKDIEGVSDKLDHLDLLIRAQGDDYLGLVRRIVPTPPLPDQRTP